MSSVEYGPSKSFVGVSRQWARYRCHELLTSVQISRTKPRVAYYHRFLLQLAEVIQMSVACLCDSRSARMSTFGQRVQARMHIVAEFLKFESSYATIHVCRIPFQWLQEVLPWNAFATSTASYTRTTRCPLAMRAMSYDTSDDLFRVSLRLGYRSYKPYQAAIDAFTAEDVELVQTRRSRWCLKSTSPPSCAVGRQMAKVAKAPGSFPRSRYWKEL